MQRNGQTNKVIEMSELRRHIMMQQDEPKLPEEYQEVEYLESTGTQYILTNIYADATTWFSFYYEAGSYARLYGCRNADLTKANLVTIGENNGLNLYFGYDDKSTYLGFSRQEGSVVVKKGTIYVNGEEVYTFEDGDFVCEYPIALFAFMQNGQAYITTNTTRLYFFYVRSVLTGKRTNKLIPCKRKNDNKPGFFDVYTNVFYTNRGTGEFRVGHDV